MTADVTNEWFNAADGILTFDLGENTYTTTLSDPTLPNNASGERISGFMVAGNQDEVATLRVQNGTLNTVTALVGGATGAGTLIITGSGTVWNNSGSSLEDLSIAHRAGAGTLRIEDGAEANVGDVTMGRRVSGTASIVVDGGSTLTVGNFLRMARNSPGVTATVEVLNGSTLNTESEVMVASDANVSASLIIDNSTLMATGTSGFLVGWGGDADTVGEFIVRNNATATLANTPSFERHLEIGRDDATGVLRIQNNSVLNVVDGRVLIGRGGGGTGIAEVEGGSTFTTLDLRVGVSFSGDSQRGELLVTGPDSVVTFGFGSNPDPVVNPQLIVGSGGNEALLDIRDGGLVTYDDPASVVSVGDLGEVRIEAGLLQTPDITFEEGSFYTIALSTGHFNPLIETNTATLEDNVTLTLELASGFDAQLGEVFQILAYDDGFVGNGLIGQFDGLQEGAILSVQGFQFDFELSYGDGIADSVTLTVIPEPGLAGLGLGLLALLGLIRRPSRH